MRCSTGRQAWRSEGDRLPECCPSAGAGFGESHQEGCPAGVGSSSCSDSGLQVVQSLGHQSWGMGGEESREQSGLEPQLCWPVTGSQVVGGLTQSVPCPRCVQDKGIGVYSAGRGKRHTNKEGSQARSSGDLFVSSVRSAFLNSSALALGHFPVTWCLWCKCQCCGFRHRLYECTYRLGWGPYASVPVSLTAGTMLDY